ncbi:hypothetical protein N7495_008869 [Penicillium taxi]|uniref:uncharacterized protein n=1 Tax=Penicillium taxi TaxID=168475 RepID=UPI002545B714|nr:uncharacterized protein N7495_008869 [Penicillium taxi]KAJ5888828.1 hypothetical protein N7495_008869 [Penicillium taxi]
MTSDIPEILLLCMDAEYIIAINKAFETKWPTYASKIKITPKYERLHTLPPTTKYDLVVSSANSYGRLDGGFNDAISKFFSPKNDYGALTRATQQALYRKWRGFAPPGTCTLVRFPEGLQGNAPGCRWLALCPTMREPSDVRWDREVVYECIWSLMCQVEGHNRNASPGQYRIRRLLMVPFAVGAGKVSKERWAEQTVLALKHFVDSVEHPAKWQSLEWGQAERYCNDVATTWK